MRFLKYFYSTLLGLLFCLLVYVIAYGLGEQVIIAPSATHPTEENITPGADKTHPLLSGNQLAEAYGADKSVYSSAGGDFRLYAGGYFQGDILSLHNARPLKGDANLRAMRVSLGFDYRKFYQFYISYDFATSRLYNLLFTYDNFKYFTANVGQFSPVFGLENTGNVPFLTFLEESLPNLAFTPPYVPGAQIGFYHSPFVLYAVVFGPTLGSTVVGRTPYGAIVTTVYSPIHTDTQVVHLGVSGWHQSMDSRHLLDVSAEPEIFSYNDGVLIDTANITYVNSYDVIDGAAAFEQGPFEIESEYSHTWVNRDLNFSSPQFWGYYITASYFLTGESRLYNYKYASFVDITPIKGKYGAWQIGMRYSQLNLTNQNITGGREKNITVGLNWYPMRHIEVLLNYVRAMATPNANGVNQTANMYALRLQFVY